MKGRPKGKANLSDDAKIGIIGAKKLQLMSQGMIANQFGVARFTVNRMDENDLSPDGKIKLDSFIEKLSNIRDKTANLIIEKLDNKSIKDGVLPTLLNIANQNYRLETDQPTSITKAENINPVAIALSNAIASIRAKCEEQNLPFPSESELLARIDAAAKANNIDAGLLRAKVLDSPVGE